MHWTINNFTHAPNLVYARGGAFLFLWISFLVVSVSMSKRYVSSSSVTTHKPTH